MHANGFSELRVKYCSYFELVEAAGVEPASENSGSLATTCLSPRLILSARCPESGATSETSLCIFETPGEALENP